MASFAIAPKTTSAVVNSEPDIIIYGAYWVDSTTTEEGVTKTTRELKTTQKDSEITKKREAGLLFGDQSFGYNKPKTIAGISELIPDEEEAVAIFNVGLKIRLNTRVNALMTDLDNEGNPTFEGQNGVYDLTEILREPAQKRNLSELDKAAKQLNNFSGMTPELLASIMAQLRAASTAQATPQTLSGAEQQ